MHCPLQPYAKRMQLHSFRSLMFAVEPSACVSKALTKSTTRNTTSIMSVFDFECKVLIFYSKFCFRLVATSALLYCSCLYHPPTTVCCWSCVRLMMQTGDERTKNTPAVVVEFAQLCSSTFTTVAFLHAFRVNKYSPQKVDLVLVHFHTQNVL